MGLRHRTDLAEHRGNNSNLTCLLRIGRVLLQISQCEAVHLTSALAWRALVGIPLKASLCTWKLLSPPGRNWPFLSWRLFPFSSASARRQVIKRVWVHVKGEIVMRSGAGRSSSGEFSGGSRWPTKSPLWLGWPVSSNPGSMIASMSEGQHDTVTKWGQLFLEFSSFLDWRSADCTTLICQLSNTIQMMSIEKKVLGKLSKCHIVRFLWENLMSQNSRFISCKS